MTRERTYALLRTAVIIGIILCLTAAVGAVEARAAEGAGTVTASALNMRSEPSTASSVVTTVSHGTVVLVTDTLDGWYKVVYQGQSGYMSKDYVTLSTEATGSFGSGSVKGTYVNVRSGPGLGYGTIGSANTGESYAVTGVSGSWYKIDYKGAAGYVYGDYLTFGAAAGATATPAPQTQSTTQTTGVITGNYVRMRSGPGTGYSVLGTYNNGTKMTITGQSGDWYAVSCNGTAGYVSKQYLSQSGVTANVEAVNDTPAVTTTAVNMREGPSTAYTSKRVLAAGSSVTITGKSGQWYRVSFGGQSGFVLGSYVSTKESQSANSAATVPAGQTSSANAGDPIVAEARKYLGVRYVYGGTSPSGFDCSGFVYYVYKQCGYSIARTATAQNGCGTQVARGDMRPGDIIIFYNGYKSAIGHAGIYIGNNQFIHASSGGGRVMISNLSETYYNTRFYSARRIVK